MSRRKLVIAIDGPAGSGKSTTARLVARRLGYLHVDTGAMYRAVTLKVLRSGIDPLDAERVGRLVESTHVELHQHDGRLRVVLDGVDVTEEIRTPDVTRAVSSVSALRKVREAMVRQQRLVDKEGGIVLDGRDIGTVVFPDADLKFFMVADIEERARRRVAELRGQGIEARLEDMTQDIRKRDSLDSTRSESPLRQAPDAIEIDTTRLSIDQQVDFVIRRVQEVEERNTRR